MDLKDDIARFLERNPVLSFVARDNGQLVGVVLCSHDGRRGYIDQLAVRKSHRRQGIGKGLVARCLYNLMRIGIHKWHLFVFEDNQDAIAFWKKLGWAERVELVTMSHHHVNGA
jgi:ribosomal protein S18 acetylase RimI-like enzyme